MSGGKAARILAGLAVLAVAVVAGIVSFTHIEALALAHGEASRLSRTWLVLGILAPLAANVAAGPQLGIVGGLVNVWPAIAFIVASEILAELREVLGTEAGRWQMPRER